MPCRAFPAVAKPPPTSESVWLCAGSETPIDEDGRSFKVDEVMAEFADSIEEIEDEHSSRHCHGNRLWSAVRGRARLAV